VNRRPSLIDCGEELPGGRVRCRRMGCRRWCASWLGLAIHLRKCHGMSAVILKYVQVSAETIGGTLAAQINDCGFYVN